MTVLSSDLREALARVGTSTLTGVLNKRGLRSMTLYDVSQEIEARHCFLKYIDTRA